MEEFEIKFLEVNVPELEKKLISIGAYKIGEYDYRRALFDYPDFRLSAKQAWIKLRTDSIETTLSYKERIGFSSHDGSTKDEGMKEIEIVVDNYRNTFELLKSLGLIVKREEDNRRIRYKKEEITFDIDIWPHIPPYLEIEGSTMQDVEKAAADLGFDPKEGLICSPKQVYKKYGYELDDYSSITFAGFVKK